ncbi:MAG: hypothetical protein C0503_12115 [Gemmatimonas sp.]|nr:hypothetical protein [Gemmatimonas sp.]
MDELLARDGYSERPPLLRALALALVGLVFVLIDGPPKFAILLVLAAVVEYGRYVHRRRERLPAPSARP